MLAPVGLERIRRVAAVHLTAFGLCGPRMAGTAGSGSNAANSRTPRAATRTARPCFASNATVGCQGSGWAGGCGADAVPRSAALAGSAPRQPSRRGRPNAVHAVSVVSSATDREGKYRRGPPPAGRGAASKPQTPARPQPRANACERSCGERLEFAAECDRSPNPRASQENQEERIRVETTTAENMPYAGPPEAG